LLAAFPTGLSSETAAAGYFFFAGPLVGAGL